MHHQIRDRHPRRRRSGAQPLMEFGHNVDGDVDPLTARLAGGGLLGFFFGAGVSGDETGGWLVVRGVGC
ncbi:hypothetical protein JCM18916_3984 [Cutibacterium acnes JCM 18916]|nr:hypothetical protein JCM18916_3984 [Cutibacterium acnes JCM 18916]